MMVAAMGILALLLTSGINDADSDFISRVEHTKMLDSAGKLIPRLERDERGEVQTLYLSDMQLSAAEYSVIGHLKMLRRLTLFRTNVTNMDLRKFSNLPHLEGLNLTSTAVSDASIDEIIKMKSLTSVCLGDVSISAEAVSRLKGYFKAHRRRLSLGYSQRKPVANGPVVGQR